MRTLWEAIHHFATLAVDKLARGDEGQLLVDEVLRTRLPFMMVDSQSKHGCYVAVKKKDIGDSRIKFYIYNYTSKLEWICHVDKSGDEIYIYGAPKKVYRTPEPPVISDTYQWSTVTTVRC